MEAGLTELTGPTSRAGRSQEAMCECVDQAGGEGALVGKSVGGKNENMD